MRTARLIAVLLLFAFAVPGQEPTEPDPQPGEPAREVPPGRDPGDEPAAGDEEVPEARSTSGTSDRPEAAADGGSGEESTGVPPAIRDERSVVLVQRICETRSHSQEVTLFANGTVRVRQTLDETAGGVRRGSFGGPGMALGELPPDELAAWVDSVRLEDLGESGRHSAGPVGDMVARCRLVLDYDAMARWVGPLPPPQGDRGDWRPAGRREFEYGGFDSFGLGFARVLERVDSLATRADLAAGRRTLPPRYEPAVGDVLRRADGMLFRVERATASPGGWELQGVSQPLTLYVMEDRFPSLFTELVRRRSE